MSKEINALDIFTKKMLEDGAKCKTTKERLEKVILPNMKHINKATEQENDPKYMAYLLEYVLGKLGKI